MRISLVIPNYNGEKVLKENLPKIFQVIEPSVEIIIVDDASDDGSIRVIKQQILKFRDKRREIKFLRNEKNFGFSTTVNRGVKQAKGQLIVLLNSDVVPEKNFLESALPHFRDSKVFAVGFLQKCPQNGEIVLRGRGVGKFEKGFLFHSRGVVSQEELKRRDNKYFTKAYNFQKTLWVSGGAGIFRRGIWEKLGGLDEIYNPFYWEDIDLSYRALKSGYKIIFERESRVFHSQEKTIRGYYRFDFIRTVAYRNQILFVWLNITDKVMIFQHIFFLPYHLSSAFFRRDWAFLKAFFSALKLFPQVLVKRRQKKKFFKLKDREILHFVRE